MKTQRWIQILGATCCMLMFSACLSDSTSEEEFDNGPVGFRDAFFPMAVGNHWEYEHVVAWKGDTMASVFDRSIIGYRYDSTRNNIWWDFDAWWYFGREELMQQGDEILTLRGTLSGRLYIVPEAGVDTMTFYGIVPGDDDVPVQTVAVRIGTYSTPAGDFEDCISYAIPNRRGTFNTQVLCPQIGLVAEDISYPDNIERIRLISYNLIR